TRSKDHEVRMQLRRVGVIWRVDIADVISDEVESCKVKRRTDGVLDIDDVSVIYDKTIDFEWISAFERILPAFLLQRNSLVFLSYELSAIDVELWAPEQHVRHYTPRDEFFPFDMKAHYPDICDWRARMCLLDDLNLAQGKTSAHQLQMCMTYRYVVALELLVHRSLGACAYEVV